MNIALDSDSNRITALPNNIAICPICREEVISKCGNIKVWHWAHKKGEDCDSFGEPETEWHLNWKSMFPEENQEVVICEEELIEKEIKEYPTHDPETKHRADVFINNLFIEFQNSPISSEEITEREEFYNKLIWLINGETFCKGLVLKRRTEFGRTFRWKNPPKSWWFAKKPIYIDLSFLINKIKERKIECSGEKFDCEAERDYYIYRNLGCIKKETIEKTPIFLIKKLYPNLPCGGYGVLLSKEQFIKGVMNNGRYSN